MLNLAFLDTLLLDPSERLHWAGLLSALSIALLALRLRILSLEQVRTLWSPSIWWHPSARLDYLIVACNGALVAFLTVPWFLSLAGIAALTSLALKRVTGHGVAFTVDPWLLTGAFMAASFLADDFARYLLHRWQHASPVLWQFHQVITRPAC